MSDSKLADKIRQDAQFFSSMLCLVPSAYLAPAEQSATAGRFTHSKSTAAPPPRQAMKEQSKSGLKAKAKFDPANYTSVLPANGRGGKAQAAAADDSDDDMDGDDSDEDGEDDDEDDSDAMEEDEAPAKGKNKAAAAAAPAAAANGTAAKPASSGPHLYAGAPLTTQLPVPSLSSLSASVGMDQLRQRLHERIQGLTQRRKPEDHPFAKKRHKKDPEQKKREKNEAKPSTHRNTAPVPAEKASKKHARDSADADAQPAKKAKSSASPSSATPRPSSSSPTLAPRLRESDLLDSNDFQFAALKPLANPTEKSGSFSLQGKQQRKKHKSDEALLKDTESFQAKIADLKSSGATAEADALSQERAMSNALRRAQGERVKDDSKLLKKSLKRDEKKKEKSRAQWSERTAAQKSTQDAFHAAKVASAMKKGLKDRTRAGGDGKGDEGAKGAGAAGKSKGDKGGSAKKAAGGRAGFEGKAKKFLN